VGALTGAVQVSLLGDVVAMESRAADRAVARRVAAYRRVVQDSIAQGMGLDQAHAAGRELIREAHRALRAAGLTEQEAWDRLAGDFHA
jgi:hypothetical protein